MTAEYKENSYVLVCRDLWGVCGGVLGVYLKLLNVGIVLGSYGAVVRSWVRG